MPLVFVHGVNVRDNEEYYREEKIRDGLFREFILKGSFGNPNATILNPYWGKHGAKYYWDHKSLPQSGEEAFGSDEKLAEIIADIVPDVIAEPHQLLSIIAQKKTLEVAIDCIWAAAAHTEGENSTFESLAAIADSAIQYAQANPSPDWNKSVQDNDQFIENLLNEVERWREDNITQIPAEEESFGSMSDIWDHLKLTADNLTGAAGEFISLQAVKRIRPKAHKRFALFLGDVFKYINSRGTVSSPGDIIKEVGSSFITAANQKNYLDNKLIIVAHSMGGNITYDILTHFYPDLVCDLLITVGSQVGLFEELKLFQESDTTIPTSKTPRVSIPANIKHWINIFDPNDIFSFVTNDIFEGSQDFKYANNTSVLSAHSMYFLRPSFHQRLAKRISEMSL